MDAKRLVDALLEAYTQDDWNWVYEQTERAIRIIREILPAGSSKKPSVTTLKNRVNARMRAEGLPIRFTLRGAPGAHDNPHYDPEKKMVSMVADDFLVEPEPAWRDWLSHELTHALQHKKSGFASPLYDTRPYFEQPDEMTAWIAGQSTRYATPQVLSNAKESSEMAQWSMSHLGFKQKKAPPAHWRKIKNRWKSTFARHHKNQLAALARLFLAKNHDEQIAHIAQRLKRKPDENELASWVEKASQQAAYQG